ncbi:alkaline phosphatase PhoX [Haladaptatus sp.]|uniref:alkaline phosphatase PhoX n=1 Tax=Haladaptatus sp. TaxID=1973141 RepID=UPI003C685C59
MAETYSRRKALSILGLTALSTAGVSVAKEGNDGNGQHQQGNEKDGKEKEPRSHFDQPALTRFATVPLGAEVTGLRMAPDGQLFMNVQHPNEDNPTPYDASVVGAVVGIDGSGLPTDVPNLPAASTDVEKQTTRTAIGQHQVLATGAQKLGNGDLLGVPNDADGNPMTDEAESDMNAFVPAGENEGYLFTNWEAQPGMISRMFLSRDEGNTEWTVEDGSIENLDVRGMEGTWNNCNGSLSPWNTPLSSEEYEPDAKAWFESDEKTYGNAEKTFESYLGYFGNAYRYGFIVEVEDPTGDATPTKRFALGRASHEVGEVLGDERTVYLTDDYEGGVLYKFVADEAGDLSAGTLYAAKLEQDATDDVTKAGFDVEWVELAHGEEDEIESWISEYDDQDPTADGYEAKYITDHEIREWANGNAEDDRVAFLETRKAAAALGATNEWQKLEGISAPSDAKPGDSINIACSNVHATMSDVDGDVMLEEDTYGAVYSARLTGSYDIKRIEPSLVGGPEANVVAPGDDGKDANGMLLNTLANPDNIVTLDDGRVLVGEDGDHENNVLWLFTPGQRSWKGNDGHGNEDGNHGHGKDDDNSKVEGDGKDDGC